MKRSYDCAHCGEIFDNITDHMVHVCEEHEGAARLRRPASCWRCASEIDLSKGLTCESCGFTLPAVDSHETIWRGVQTDKPLIECWADEVTS